VTGRTAANKKITATPRSKTAQRSSSSYNRPQKLATTSRTTKTRTVTKRNVVSKPSGRTSKSNIKERTGTAKRTANRSPSRSSGKSNITRSRSTRLK
jgi:hypothetical protein